MKMKLLMWGLLLGLFAGVAGAQEPLRLERRYDTQGQAMRQAFAPVVRDARQSVVRIMIDGRQVALGTCVGRGLIATKASEIAGEGVIRCVTAWDRTFEAQRLGADRSSDVALLEVDAPLLEPIALGEADDLRLGQWVIVPGIEAVPEAVGVLSVEPRRVAGVRLGVSLYDSPDGPVITSVLPRMGAAEAGIQRGDRVLEINGHEVDDAATLIEQLQGQNAGDVIELMVERDGQALRLEVELRLRPVNPHSRADMMNTAGNELSRRRDGFERVMQHDATIAPNECGGPLVNLKGQVIGMNIARAGRVKAYALPAEALEQIVDTLRGPMAVRRADEPEAH